MAKAASESGQAAVDLVASVPALIVLVGLALQVALAGAGLWSASLAARTGARAAYTGADGRARALAALPEPLRDGASAEVSGSSLRVGVRVPALVPGLPRIPVSASAALGAAPGEAGEGAGR